MLVRKKWAPGRYTVGAKDAVPADEAAGTAEVPAVPGELVTFKVKVLDFEEYSPFNAAMNKAWAAIEVLNENSTGSERAIAMDNFFASIPKEQVRNAFEHWVRDVTGIQTENEATGDLVTLTTGADLYKEAADQGLVFAVLMALRNNAALSASEGKASASPSTSATELEAPGRSRTAGPVESGSGTTPATAQETPQAGV